MLNSLTEDILCSLCNKTNTFDMETWQGLLDDAMKEAPKFKLSEGQSSTIFRGEYNYKLVYGRQEPRCVKCKQDIDASRLEEYSAAGNIKCSKCSNTIFVRKPSELIAKVFPGLKYIVGEDNDLLSESKLVKAPDSVKPVLFTCPSCAGNLEIDGTDRMVECKYCDSQIYLPDDLWFRLHPAKSVERWYMVIDAESASLGVDGLPDWHYFSDLTADKSGILYACGTDDSADNFILWAVGNDFKAKWVRRDLKFNYEHTGITITNDGNLYLWDKQKHSLLKISSKDGSTIEKIEGSPASEKNPYAFNLKGCGSLVSDTDGSILALINNTIARFSPKGERIDLWSGKKWAFFSTGIGLEVPESDPEWAPYVKDIGSFPKRINSDYTRLNIGWDGYLYMMDKSSSDGEVAKYASDGTRLWSKLIPLNYKESKPCADAAGNVYILGTDENSNTHLVRYNPSIDKFETLLTDLVEGGVLDDEQHLAVTPEGTIFILNTYGGMKVFSPELKMICRSRKSEEDDNEVLEKKKDAIEKDEEFS